MTPAQVRLQEARRRSLGSATAIPAFFDFADELRDSRFCVALHAACPVVKLVNDWDALEAEYAALFQTTRPSRSHPGMHEGLYARRYWHFVNGQPWHLQLYADDATFVAYRLDSRV